jgi:hypothetical protein
LNAVFVGKQATSLEAQDVVVEEQSCGVNTFTPVGLLSDGQRTPIYADQIGGYLSAVRKSITLSFTLCRVRKMGKNKPLP